MANLENVKLLYLFSQQIQYFQTSPFISWTIDIFAVFWKFSQKVWAELDLDLTLYTDFRLKFTWNTSEVQRKLGRYTNILFIPRCLWGGHVVGWIAWVLLWKRKRNVHITHSLNGHPNTARQDEIILKRGKRKKQPPIVLVQVICNFSSWQNKIKLTAINISDAIE